MTVWTYQRPGNPNITKPSNVTRQTPHSFELIKNIITNVGALGMGEHNIIDNFLDDENCATQLCAAVDAGLALPYNRIRNLLDHRGFRAYARQRWSNPNLFNPATDHLVTRHALIVGAWARDITQSMFTAVCDQASRLLAAGIVDIDYMLPLAATGDPLNPYTNVQAWLCAHDELLFEELVEDLNDEWVTQLSQEVLAARETAFVTHWLTSALQTDEYTAVKDFAPELLKNLYDDIWEAGYRGHHARVTTAGSRP